MREIDQKLPDIRCAHCGRKLGEGYALVLSIKCPRCGTYNTLRAARPEQAGRGASSKEATWQVFADHTIHPY